MYFIYWGLSSVARVVGADDPAIPYRRPTYLYRERGRLERGPAIHYGKAAWGPMHLDLEQQAVLRSAYFQGTQLDRLNEEFLTRYEELLRGEEEVVFWSDRQLDPWVGLLWILQALVERGADLSRASLLLSPIQFDQMGLSLSDLEKMLETRLPLQPLLEHLLAIRKHLAAPAGELWMDLSPLPASIRDWCGVTNQVLDYLPNSKGLDLIDQALFHHLSTEWRDGTKVALNAFLNLDRHDLRPEQCWQQLLELSGRRTTDIWLDPDRWSVVEVRSSGPVTMKGLEFRLLPRGERIKAGKQDALKYRFAYCRWAGGRRVAPPDPPRRPRWATDVLNPRRRKDGTYR